MKKQLLTFLFLGFTIIVSAQKKSYTIGVLLDNRSEEVEPIRLRLEEQIKAVVGEDADIRFPEEYILVNEYAFAKAEENYNQLLSNDTDIILAFGTINNLLISKQDSYPKPTILFGNINQDLVDVDLTKTSSGISNFTYLIDSQSYNEDLKKFKELTNFKNIGIIIEEEIVNVLPIKETFQKELNALDASYKLIPYTSVQDIISNLSGVDAIYIAGGFFLNENEIQQLATVFIEEKIPAFTSTNKEDVISGLFATNQDKNNLEQLLRRIALDIEAYVNGNDLATLPIYIENNTRLTINYNTAELIGVPIKYSLINDTDFVGEFKNSLSEKKYNLINAINQALDKNLSLASDRKDIELSAQDVKIAKSNYLPTLTASANGTYVDPDQAEISFGQSPEFSTSGDITLEQTLFSAAANANITIEKKLLKAQEETFNTNQLDVIFDVANTYFTTLILKANAQIELSNLDLTKENLQIAERNFEAGEEGKSDVLRFTSEMAQNTQSMVEAINNLEQGFVNLNQILNNPVNKEIDVEDVELDKGILEQYNYNEITELLDNPTLRESFIEFLIQEALQNSPELKNLDYNLEATERSVKLYGTERFLPTLALQGQYNNTFSRSGAGSTAQEGFSLVDNSYNVGVNISIPIFNQNTNTINKQTAIIQKDQLLITKENNELAIAANIRNSVLTLINQVSNIALSNVSESAAKESLLLTQTAYATGSVSIIELIDSQNNYLSAQLSRTNAVYNYLINALQLERNLGYYFLLNSPEDNTKFRQRFLEFTTNKN